MTEETIKELSKSLSVVVPQAYDDVVHQPAQNTGTALGTITGLLNTILTPFEILNKTVALKKEKFLKEYENNLNNVPSEKQCLPAFEIAAPIVDHLKYKITDDTLREKYAKLLSEASNCDSQTKPLLSFDNVLNQLSPYEIKLLSHLFASTPNENYALASIKITLEIGYTIPFRDIPDITFNDLSSDELSVMISNLERLGLISIDRSQYVEPESKYDYILNSNLFINLKASCEKERESNHLSYPNCEIVKHYYYLTEFGKSFVSTVIV